MRDWRNRQTRTFEGRVGDRVSSSLTSRTKKRATQLSVALFFCVRGCCIFLYDVATSGGVRNLIIYILRNHRETLLLSVLGCVSALGCAIKQVALRRI